MNNNIFAPEEETAKRYTPKSSIRKWWWLLILFLAWLVFNGRYGKVEFDAVSFYIVVFVLLIFFGYGIDMGFKHFSPKVIANPINSTFDGTVDKIGNYGLIRLGGFKAGNWYHPGNEGTLIAPRTTILPRGMSATVACRVEEVTEDELPDTIRDDVVARMYPKPYYLGYTDEEMFMAVPDLLFTLKENKQLNKRVAFLQKIANMNLKQIEDIVSFITRMKEAGSRESITALIKKKLGGKE